LRGVEVRAGGGRWRVVSDDSGRFRFTTVDAGSHIVVARRLGLAPESLSTVVRGGETSYLRIVLRPEAAPIGEVVSSDTRVLSARHQGFEQRLARKNGGYFITRPDIDKRSPQVTSDLIRRVPGVKLVDSLGVMLPMSTRGPKVVLINNRPVPVQCIIRVGVDGSLKEPYFSMDHIAQQDIYGIEVYAGAASLPPEFGGARKDAGCGLIMIWTRSY
jgi:outer membrane receptor for ferrienterochelin and colicin